MRLPQVLRQRFQVIRQILRVLRQMLQVLGLILQVIRQVHVLRRKTFYLLMGLPWTCQANCLYFLNKFKHNLQSNALLSVHVWGDRLSMKSTIGFQHLLLST